MIKSRWSIYIVLVLLLAAIGGSILADPGEFDLLEPGTSTEPGPTILSPQGVMEFVWQQSVGAMSYQLIIKHLADTETVVHEVFLTDAKDISCGLRCIYNLSKIETVLNKEGLYSWNVIAYDEGELKTLSSPQYHTGANAFHYFTVEFAPLPAPFNLLEPENAAVIADVNTEIVVKWEASDEVAVSYEWTLTRPVETAVTIPVETSACVENICTLTIPAETAASTLTENGVYEWTVNAISSVPDEIEATNAPFTFTVADPTLQELEGFALVSPVNNTFIRVLATDSEVTWTHDPEATSYTFTLFMISTNTSRIGQVTTIENLTPAEDDDALLCTEDLCVLSTNFAELLGEESKGLYSWTVFAVNDFGTVEANNAPYLFEVNTGVINLVDNGGFEEHTGKIPAIWTASKLVKGNKVICNTEDTAYTPYGECAVQFKAGTPSKLRQSLDYTLMLDGDTVTFRTAIDPRTATVGKKLGSLKIFLSDDTVEVINIEVPAVELRGIEDYIVVEDAITLDLGERTITKAMVIFKNRLNSGKLLFDEVSVTLEQIPLPPEPETMGGLIPLPAPAGS